MTTARLRLTAKGSVHVLHYDTSPSLLVQLSGKKLVSCRMSAGECLTDGVLVSHAGLTLVRNGLPRIFLSAHSAPVNASHTHKSRSAAAAPSMFPAAKDHVLAIADPAQCQLQRLAAHFDMLSRLLGAHSAACVWMLTLHPTICRCQVTLVPPDQMPYMYPYPRGHLMFRRAKLDLLHPDYEVDASSLCPLGCMAWDPHQLAQEPISARPSAPSGAQRLWRAPCQRPSYRPAVRNPAYRRQNAETNCVQSADPDLQNYPLAKKLRPTEVVMAAGDVLIFPAATGHQTRTLTVRFSARFPGSRAQCSIRLAGARCSWPACLPSWDTFAISCRSQRHLLTKRLLGAGKLHDGGRMRLADSALWCCRRTMSTCLSGGTVKSTRVLHIDRSHCKIQSLIVPF